MKKLPMLGPITHYSSPNEDFLHVQWKTHEALIVFPAQCNGFANEICMFNRKKICTVTGKFRSCCWHRGAAVQHNPQFILRLVNGGGWMPEMLEEEVKGKHICSLQRVLGAEFLIGFCLMRGLVSTWLIDSCSADSCSGRVLGWFWGQTSLRDL